MKTMYGIKQKYNLKDYVKYYQSRNSDGKPCNEQFGYINEVCYRANVKGEIELHYSIGDFIGSSSGYLVSQNAIIKRIKPKTPNYGYREYLKHQISCNEYGIKTLQQKLKENKKKLEDFDNETKSH